MLIEIFLWIYIYLVILVIFAIALYGIIFRPNIIKKIIALTIFADTANTLMILVGYRFIYPISPPIITSIKPTPEQIRAFVRVAVDPLPPALVITAIVINMAVTMLITFLAIQAYRLYGSLDARKIARLKG